MDEIRVLCFVQTGLAIYVVYDHCDASLYTFLSEDIFDIYDVKRSLHNAHFHFVFWKDKLSDFL